MSHLITVVETPLFIREAGRLLSDKDRLELVEFLAENPESGVIMQGTGGVRKLRWRGSGRGKRGGVRIIYYWHAARSRVYLLFMYPKSVQDTLTPQQAEAIRKAVKEIV